jgi:ribonuclease-3
MATLPMDKLEQAIGHNFRDQEQLKNALTHSSTGHSANYERLEFLGDRVLGLVIAQILFEKFPAETEGDLAKRLAALVQGEMLGEIAREINLGAYIVFSDAERDAGGGQNVNILADVFEALIGALYLEAGLAVCRIFIEKLWGNRFFDMKAPPQHPKTALQEWAQGRGLPLPLYDIADQTGPDHAPLFHIRLSVKGYKPVISKGASRQEAEKQAALAFLKEIGLA